VVTINTSFHGGNLNQQTSLGGHHLKGYAALSVNISRNQEGINEKEDKNVLI
jgi:hypothetical protein